MKYCVNCGSQIAEGLKICGKCGYKIIEKESEIDNISKAVVLVILLIIIGLFAYVVISTINTKPPTPTSPKYGSISLSIYNEADFEQDVDIYINGKFEEKIHLPAYGLFSGQSYTVNIGQWTIKAIPQLGNSDEQTVYVSENEVEEIDLRVGG